MTRRSQKPPKSISISPPELPDPSQPESSFDTGFNSQERYSDIVLAHRTMSGRRAPHLTLQYARFQDVDLTGCEMKFLRLADA
ncbi:MAG TPA: hypothetical protein VEZ90_05895, partial [Blastocatellia bacterium]|nr:hypothetical protein [Blastocatellia bacterium]